MKTDKTTNTEKPHAVGVPVESIVIFRCEIDDFAFLGHDYAVSPERTKIPAFNSDMDLMAFNLGIKNANIRNRLNIDTLKTVVKKTIEHKNRATDKELAVVWGSN